MTTRRKPKILTDWDKPAVLRRRIVRGVLLVILFGGFFLMGKMFLDNAREEGKALNAAQAKMPGVVKHLEDSIAGRVEVVTDEVADEPDSSVAVGTDDAKDVQRGKMDLLRRLFVAIDNAPDLNGKWNVVERNSTERFKNYARERRDALPAMLFPASGEGSRASIWHYGGSWYAVRLAADSKGFALKLVKGPSGGYKIDALQMAVDHAVAAEEAGAED